MSFTLTVWPQPADQPIPTGVMQAQAQLDTVQDRPGTQPEPRFLALARALNARFPDTEDGEGDMYDHGLDILEKSPDNDRSYNIGLWARDDSFEVAFNHLVVQANDLGLHVMDGQNGVVYLADGNVLTLGAASAASRTYRLDDAIGRKDWRAAWLECRRLAPQGLPEVLTVWALLVSQGRQAPAHPILGAALAKLSGTDPHKDKRVQWCLSKVLPSQWPQEAQLLEGLRKAPDLVAFVDAELHRSTTTAAPPAPPPGGGSASAPLPPDADTAQAAKALGIDADLVARAEAGSSNAQFNLAMKFIQPPAKPTQQHAKIAQLWLERAAARGQPIANAVLGDALLRGWRGFPVDMARGLALLEAAVAEDDVDGLNYLATYLYDKSVRRRPDKGGTEQLKDAASQRNLTRVPQLLARAAAQGSPRGLFYLAARLWDEVGVPRDDIGAKAVMQLARTRASKYCTEQPETVALMAPTTADSAAVMALAKEWGADLKQLPELLRQRHAGLVSAAPLPKPPMATVTPKLAQRLARDEDEDDDAHSTRAAAAHRFHAGHVALVIGALGFVPLMMLTPSLGKWGFRGIAAVVGLVGAFGVWRTTQDLDWGNAKRTVVAALALLPGVGFIACVAVLLRLVRGY